MDKKKYRPISVLHKSVKGIWKSNGIPINNIFNDRFSPHLSGYIKHVKKSRTITADMYYWFVDTCKAALDKKQVYGAVLIDLSKAFDCLPYRLTVSKLYAYYGVNGKACMLITSYLLTENGK